MDCTVSQRELVPFHFGQVEAPLRAQLEQHLTSCPSCLRDYLVLKRDIELGAAAAPAPAPAARARLRQAVAARLPGQPARARARWERPIAAAFAGASLVAAMLFAYGVVTTPGGPPLSPPRVSPTAAPMPVR